MKPVVIYLDDEPHNLTVFEASLPSEWEIKTFTDGYSALEALQKTDPWVIVTDQRMPGITGVKFLELARQIRPNAVRIVATGYSEEDLVIESVRKAQVFDYIKKPWEPDELEAAVRRGLEFYKVNEAARKLQIELAEREAALEKQNRQLLQMTHDLKESNDRESALRKELECWVPPNLLASLQSKVNQFPQKKDIVGLAFDVVKSSEIHGIQVAGRTLRSVVIQAFIEAVLKNNGWCESRAGDSAYAHFGLWERTINPSDGALAAAKQFRVVLRNICEVHHVAVECGVALHMARETLVDIHTIHLSTPTGSVVQKSFDTSSLDIDLLHRMEKLVHQLPGSNIIMSGDFLRTLSARPARITELGSHLFKGQTKPVDLFLIPSDRVADSDLEKLRTSLGVISIGIRSAA